MSVSMVVMLAVFSALWIIGLMDQIHSDQSIMRYLAFSLGLIALGVFRFTHRKK